MGQVAQNAGPGLGGDLDKGKVPEHGGLEELGDGSDDEFAEDRAEGGCGEEIRLRVPPDPLEVPRVVTRRRMIHRQLHVAGKADPGGRIGLCAEDFKKV